MLRGHQDCTWLTHRGSNKAYKYDLFWFWSFDSNSIAFGIFFYMAMLVVCHYRFAFVRQQSYWGVQPKKSKSNAYGFTGESESITSPSTESQLETFAKENELSCFKGVV